MKKPRNLSVTVQYASDVENVPDAASFESWIRTALGSDGGREIVVRVIGEAESAKLNEQYRGREGATNVLAFPADEHLLALDPEAPLGDLAICAPVVEREAREQNKSPEAHWAHIAVHGALHLLGFGHETDGEAEEMEQKERDVLAELGYPDPYTPVA